MTLQEIYQKYQAQTGMSFNEYAVSRGYSLVQNEDDGGSYWGRWNPETEGITRLGSPGESENPDAQYWDMMLSGRAFEPKLNEFAVNQFVSGQSGSTAQGRLPNYGTVSAANQYYKGGSDSFYDGVPAGAGGVQVGNPGGRLIKANTAENPFPYDMWNARGNEAVYSYNPSDNFMESLGPYILAATAAGMGLAGAGVFGGAGAGLDAAGLSAMGAEAGLSGSALDAFVASGGTLGSTAAGGGGIGLGAAAAGSGGLPANYWSTMADAGGVTSDAAATGAGSVGTGSQSAWDQLIQTLTPTPTSGATSGLSQFLQNIGGEDSLFGTIDNNIAFPDLPGNFTLPQNITPDVFQGFPQSVQSLFQSAASSGLSASTATSLITKLLNGTATAADYGKLIGTAGSTALGVLGANSQQNSLAAVQDRFLSLGQPYREKLLQSYAGDYSYLNSPDMQAASKLGLDTLGRSLSKDFGNPSESPTSLNEMLRYATTSNLGNLNTYRSQLGSFGGLGVNTAGTAATAAAAGTQDAYRQAGLGLGTLTADEGDLTALWKRMQAQNGQPQYTVNKPGVF